MNQEEIKFLSDVQKVTGAGQEALHPKFLLRAINILIKNALETQSGVELSVKKSTAKLAVEKKQ